MSNLRRSTGSAIIADRQGKIVRVVTVTGKAGHRGMEERAALVQALTGRFDDHHGELAAILLTQADALTAQTGPLTTRIGELITVIPAGSRNNRAATLR